MRLDAPESGPFAPLLDLRLGYERSGDRFGVIIRVEPILEPILGSGFREVGFGARPRRFHRHRHYQVGRQGKLPDMVDLGSEVYLALAGCPKTLDRAALPS